tara:strand:- start:1158 stop:1724 length:567 start_codon:yes stop_codon:yes gene_type:complete
MPTPANRTPIRVARGTYTNLNSSLSDIQEGEICYATDENKLYVKEGSSLESTQADISGSIGVTIQGYDADTAKTDAAQTFTAAQRGEITTLTSGATVTPDLNDSNNFTLTLGENLTIANPSNCTAGQSGSIFLVQDGTGSRTAAWGSYWDFAGGVAPTLTTTASSVDRVDYVVRSATSIHAVATLNYS